MSWTVTRGDLAHVLGPYLLFSSNGGKDTRTALAQDADEPFQRGVWACVRLVQRDELEVKDTDRRADSFVG